MTRMPRNFISITFLIFRQAPHFNKRCTLTPSFPMHPFSIPIKHQKTVRFSDVFRGERKCALGINGLK